VNLIPIAIGALWVAVLAQAVFVVAYGLRSPWNTGFVGRALFIKSTVLLLALCNPLIRYYWPYPHQLVVGTVLMCMLAFSVVYQCAALLNRLWLDRQERQA
jgi:hypothetical protein